MHRTKIETKNKLSIKLREIGGKKSEIKRNEYRKKQERRRAI